MSFTDDIDAWLLEVDLWTPRETEDLVAALRQGHTVGMFEFTSSRHGQRCFIKTAHVDRILVLATSQARSDMVVLLTRSLDGANDGSKPMAHWFAPSTFAAQTGTASRLM